jgi:hypothetical protein
VDVSGKESSVDVDIDTKTLTRLARGGVESAQHGALSGLAITGPHREVACANAQPHVIRTGRKKVSMLKLSAAELREFAIRGYVIVRNIIPATILADASTDD